MRQEPWLLTVYGGFALTVRRAAVTRTAGQGVAGYAEVTLPDGRELRFAGYWDDAAATETACCDEVVTLAGQFIQQDPCDAGESYFVELAEGDGLRCEDIAHAILDRFESVGGTPNLADDDPMEPCGPVDPDEEMPPPL